MERLLAVPLQAEIDAADGAVCTVALIAYLGDNRWRALDDERRERVVAAHEIRTLEQPA